VRTYYRQFLIVVPKKLTLTSNIPSMVIMPSVNRNGQMHLIMEFIHGVAPYQNV
jgi:hypothetical protein